MFKKKTHEEYVVEAGLKNPNIEVIGQYIGANIKIKHRCKICGFEWDIRPAHVLNGIECKQCIVHRRKKTYEHYKSEVALINPNIEVIEEYQNSFTKIKHRCKNAEMNGWQLRIIYLKEGAVQNVVFVCILQKQKRNILIY